MVKKMRLGFIGTGNMGHVAHLRNYLAVPDCEVCALAELRPQLARKVAQRYGIGQVYRDHEELLASADVDGLVAIQPFVRHDRLVPKLLEARLPLLIEKPLAHSVEAGDKILAAQRKTGTPLYIAYNKRSDPAVVWSMALMRKWQQSGQYGPLRYIRISMPPGDWRAEAFTELVRTEEVRPSPEIPPPPEGFSEELAKEYKYFVDYYIHQVNLLRHLLGEDYEVAYADPARIVMAIRSQSGVPGILEMNACRTTRDWQEEAFIAFEKGWIKIALPAPLAVNRSGSVTVFQDAGDGAIPEKYSPTLPMIHSMRQQAIHFVSTLRGEKTCLCTAEEAIKDLRTAKSYIELLGGRQG